jgi:hypothetical protein
METRRNKKSSRRGTQRGGMTPAEKLDAVRRKNATEKAKRQATTAALTRSVDSRIAAIQKTATRYADRLQVAANSSKEVNDAVDELLNGTLGDDAEAAELEANVIAADRSERENREFLARQTAAADAQRAATAEANRLAAVRAFEERLVADRAQAAARAEADRLAAEAARVSATERAAKLAAEQAVRDGPGQTFADRATERERTVLAQRNAKAAAAAERAATEEAARAAAAEEAARTAAEEAAARVTAEEAAAEKVAAEEAARVTAERVAAEEAAEEAARVTAAEEAVATEAARVTAAEEAAREAAERDAAARDAEDTRKRIERARIIASRNDGYETAKAIVGTLSGYELKHRDTQTIIKPLLDGTRGEKAERDRAAEQAAAEAERRRYEIANLREGDVPRPQRPAPRPLPRDQPPALAPPLPAPRPNRRGDRRGRP